MTPQQTPSAPSVPRSQTEPDALAVSFDAEGNGDLSISIYIRLWRSSRSRPGPDCA